MIEVSAFAREDFAPDRRLTPRCPNRVPESLPPRDAPAAGEYWLQAAASRPCRGLRRRQTIVSGSRSCSAWRRWVKGAVRIATGMIMTISHTPSCGFETNARRARVSGIAESAERVGAQLSEIRPPLTSVTDYLKARVPMLACQRPLSVNAQYS